VLGRISFLLLQTSILFSQPAIDSEQ